MVVLVLDQLTKWWAVENLSRQTIDVVWTLRLHLAYNTGAAFSLGAGREFGRYIPLAALVVVGLVLWQGRTIRNRPLGAVALGLVLGGAIGNLLDRLLRAGSGGFMSGGVVDFIDLQWFPIFNVADSAITIGAILLGLVAFLTPPEEDPEIEPDAGPAEVEPAPADEPHAGTDRR